MDGWIADLLFMLLFAYMLCSRQNIAEYGLMGVPVINHQGAHQPFFLIKRYAQINQPKLLCFQKSKQTSIRKIL